MRRTIAIILAFIMLLSGCSQKASEKQDHNTESNSNSISTEDSTLLAEIPEEERGDNTSYDYSPEFASLDDEALLRYVKDEVYLELVNSLDSDKYYIENVNAAYVSKEYLEEVSYNSQANIFFGYTIEDIQNVYGDKKFVFTLGDNGDTIVEPFEDYDDTYEQIIKNVAIGTGVILVCVTVSAVTAGAGAPAVSLIFAASAKTGTIMALSSSALGGVASGVITGIQTGDMDEALKAGALAASEGFKWGAISGAIAGGAAETAKYAKAMKALEGAPIHLTKQEAAAIQMKTGYPVDVIAQFHSMEEFKVFEEAGLKATMINGQSALVRSDIDLNFIDEFGRTNLERMKLGLSPLDSTGKYYELHHIGQEADATLAILTQAEHDAAALHGFKTISEINRPEFAPIRKHFWKTMAKLLANGGI